MSTGGIIGTIAGGAIGFVIGGPLGAAVGAGLGLAAGMVIDPIEPDIAKPEPAQLSVPTAMEGAPIPDVLGISQLSGNFIWYCCPRAEEVKEDAGKGGSGEVVTGYKYYLFFAIGLCRGPVDTLYCIYDGDTLLWEGPLHLSDATNGKVSISVENRGIIDFYFGTQDQTPNSFMSGNTGYSISYKGLCYAVFENFMIGQYNRVGNLQFVIKKRPEYSFSTLKNIGDYNYNPAHAIYHLLVTDAGLPPDKIDEQSFADAANTLSQENLGISILMKEEKPLIRYIETICQHIRACLYVNAEGKIAIRLYRKDVPVEDMIKVTEDDILEEIGLERQNMIEAKNEVQVQTNTIIEE